MKRLAIMLVLLALASPPGWAGDKALCRMLSDNMALIWLLVEGETARAEILARRLERKIASGGAGPVSDPKQWQLNLRLVSQAAAGRGAVINHAGWRSLLVGMNRQAGCPVRGRPAAQPSLGVVSAAPARSQSVRTTEFDGGPVRVASLSTLPTLGIVVVSLALIVQMVMRRRRRYPRRLCRIPAILLHGEHCTFTHLIDIGRGGAKLEAPYVPVPPGTMSLLMGDLRVDCRMVWCSSLYLGVRFDRPLSAEQERSIRDDADSDLNAITVSDCHFPTCQHACARHRATAIETRRAAALLPHPAPPG